MIENLFILLTEISPKLKRILWRWWYNLLANSYQKPDLQFMNYGFDDFNSELQPLNLSPEDEDNRYYIQLYQYVSSATNLEGKKVLEVGCGRGAGAFFLAKTFFPQEMIGVDLASENITLANKFYRLPNLAYLQGDSENLPFPDHTFDVVINVESSHCYGSMTKFMQEVARVLKPNGIFAWADLRAIADLPSLEMSFRESGLKEVKRKDITANVVKALDLVNERKQHLINHYTPQFLRQAVREFAGIKEGKIYNGFVKGEMIYLSCVWQKSA